MNRAHSLDRNLYRACQVAVAASLLLLFLFSAGCTISGVSTRAEAPPFAMLNAYGQWFELAPHGRVWQPTVAYDWRPFAVGGWLWTDRGWFWDSPEPFAWVVYHYGYWTFEGATGWVWVPGYDWSPARVRWYVTEAQIGWAPMIPRAAMSHTVNPEIVWLVVPVRSFTAPDVVRYRLRSVPSDRARRPGDEKIAPDVRMVERQTSRPVVRLRTESETVRTGGQKVIQVRVTGEHAKDALTPADARGGGQQPEQKTRQQGQTRSRPPGDGQRPPNAGTPVPDSTQSRNPR